MWKKNKVEGGEGIIKRLGKAAPKEIENVGDSKYSIKIYTLERKSIELSRTRLLVWEGNGM